MNVAEFLTNYREAFGENAELPIAFWYSDTPLNLSPLINGCFFKCFHKVRNGIGLSLNQDVISCGGGRLYTGFGEMLERIPRFVSIIERYKQTPESVVQYVEGLRIIRREEKYLNFARVDHLDDFSTADGILFFAEPDVLSGLLTWAWYDNHDDDAVTTMFGSGCSQVLAVTMRENREGGRRAFLGGFDPSVRPYLRASELTFTIPITRFKQMLSTMRDSCLYDTNAWKKVKKRITSKEKVRQ